MDGYRTLDEAEADRLAAVARPRPTVVPTLRARAEALRRSLARQRAEAVARSRMPYGRGLDGLQVVVAEGVVAGLDRDGLDIMTGMPEAEARGVRGFVHRASVRVRTQGSDDYGAVNVPRRKGDGYMHYGARHERVRRYPQADGSVVVAVVERSDAWSKARTAEVGRRRLAEALAPEYSCGVGSAYPEALPATAARSWTEAHGYGRWHPAYRQADPSPYTVPNGSPWVYCRSRLADGRTLSYKVHRFTGEARAISVE